MAIHPTIAAFLATLPPPPPVLDPDAMRNLEESQVEPPSRRLPVHFVDDQVLSTSSGEVPIRIYTPAHSAEYGVLVYLHGGAFFLGSLETHDHVARELAIATGLKIVAVGYPLAPEAAFPAGLHASHDVVDWVVQHRNELRWDGKTLAMAGDSSGGNFVAAITAMDRDAGLNRITHQILYYPSLDLDFDTDRYPSLVENATGYGLETAGLRPFNTFYIDSGADPANPAVSPIKRKDLSGLPPALIITAEYDPLRDEAELYGQRLQQAGVPTTLKRYAGANHGFVANFSWIPKYHQVFEETRDFIKRVIPAATANTQVAL